MINRWMCAAFLAAFAAQAEVPGGSARFVGGSVAGWATGTAGRIDTVSQDTFVFSTAGHTARIPYVRIKSVEYGQETSRRVLLAWMISPIFLLSKARAHFVTLHFVDENGKQQALVLRVDKRSIRSTLAILEARTGRTVEYQDSEARKYRRG
jgi:hypothetical protein